MKYLILTISMIFIVNVNSQNFGCETFHTGKYKLIDSKNGINNRIERTATKQTETDLNTGKYIVFTIKWTSSCEYELTVLEGTSEMVNFFRGKTLMIQIIETFSDGYRFEGHIKGSKDYKTHFMRVL